MRELCVIEFCPVPLIHGVARLAVDGQVRRHVIERARLLEIALVAADAIGAKSDVDPGPGSGMTRIALQRGVRA